MLTEELLSLKRTPLPKPRAGSLFVIWASEAIAGN